MTAAVTVFVDGRRVEVPPGSTVLEAVRKADPDAARQVEGGQRVVTDSRGLPTAVEASVHGGAIFRLVPARSPREADGASHR